MNTSEKFEKCCKTILSIRYDNEQGGAYAYIQFLAQSRELLKLLSPYKVLERQAEAIEGINWLFNEYLGVKFTERQRVIFENKLLEMRLILYKVSVLLKHEAKCTNETLRHALAA
jgi:hypothetical protein